MNISKAQGRLRDLIDLFVPTSFIQKHIETPQQAFNRTVTENRQAIQLLANHPQSFAVLHTMCKTEPDCTDYSDYLCDTPSMSQYLLSFPPHLTRQMHATTLHAESKAATLFMVFAQIADPYADRTHIAAAIATQAEARPEASFITLSGRNLPVAQVAQHLGQRYKAAHFLAA
jgi:hypothetical protein